MPKPTALLVQRSPKQTLHHVWAPKLGRIVMLTGPDALHLWTMLEAHPEVTDYCERPAGAEDAQARPAADFWALRAGSAVWLQLKGSTTEAPVTGPAESGTSVEIISGDELQRHRTWIQNWLSLLPYLTAWSLPERQGLQPQLVAAVGQGATFEELESQFPRDDPVLTRTAIIAALHAGELVSDDLQLHPWGRHTRVRRASREFHHAPQ